MVLLALEIGRAKRSWRWNSLSKTISHRQVIGILFRHVSPRNILTQVQSCAKTRRLSAYFRRASHSFTRDVQGLIAACLGDLFDRVRTNSFDRYAPRNHWSRRYPISRHKVKFGSKENVFRARVNGKSACW